MNIFDKLKAQWIWLPQDYEVINQYVNFRDEFSLSDTENLSEIDAQLYISVDTEYAVWINGNFVDCGQYDDYPDKKAYDVLNVTKHLKHGKNVLCILGYYQGENSMQYIKGSPRLIYALEAGNTKVVSDNKTFCRQSDSYTSGDIEKVTGQLSFTFRYNAAMEDEWLSNEYKLDQGWFNAVIVQSAAENKDLYERPIKKVIIGERVNGKITAQGFFLRDKSNHSTGVNELDLAKNPTTAEQMQSDYLSSRLPMQVFQKDCSYDLPIPSEGIYIDKIADGNDGVYILIDLFHQEVGYFELEIEGEEGVIIDAAYGEHLDDLRVRASVGGRNFAFKYNCKNGFQRFTHYIKRIAGRYIELHISGIKTGITIHYAGMRSTRYPLEIKGGFSCNDRLFNRIYKVSMRTLELCMHERYEDSPWREQALYAMDSRNQALCGYYCFGEYDFPESSFTLLAESLKEDGYLEICAPTEFHITIPSFSMGWIIALADLVLYSGRIDYANKLFPVAKRMLGKYLRNIEDGLLLTPSGVRYWNFYEWADGLDDSKGLSAVPQEYDQKRYDAPLNLFFCLALEAGAKLAKWCGDLETSKKYFNYLEQTRIAIHEAFWSDENSAYKTYIGGQYPEHYAELTQALALLAKVVPEKFESKLRKRLSDKDNSLVHTTISYSLYKYEALMQEPDKYAEFVFNDIADDWGYMLYNKATSFWETIKGADDFYKAGSLCHGWSAIPIYFFQAYVLGVKPLEPGFKEFTAVPLPVVADKAFGTVPTPFGDIKIEWERVRNDVDCKISFPDSITRI